MNTNISSNVNGSTVVFTTLMSPSQSASSLQYPQVEIPFLVIVITAGIVGNLFVIGAALTEKRLRNMGVAFIINLAFADLVITAWYLPVVLANVINDYMNVFANVTWLCSLTGFLASWCCQVSMSTLMFIAINRYWKVTRNSTYHRYFGNRQIGAMIVFVWIYCFLVALPLIIGWFGSEPLMNYDTRMVACMWNDTAQPGYNVFLVVVAIFIPIVITAILYYRIFSHVKKNRKPTRQIASPNASALRANQRSMGSSVDHSLADENSTVSQQNAVRTHHTRQSSITNHKSLHTKRAEERERSLMTTLVVVVVFFVLFWTPYALMTLIDPNGTSLAKRACGWLALSNSSVNSIIYGVLNRHFRRGYINIIRRMMNAVCCCLKSRLLDLTLSGKTSQADPRKVVRVSSGPQSDFKSQTVKFG
uniref:Melatonin receptor type 1B-A-like n=1 Tax=Phallusia mammillata TaxID=59560 RepID=A0A6F9DKU3_9ASCI|nr:melatonin receptor type 1B-A-like [Phallusia mammillata]